eukprot:m.519488 g.519488  ORF g.519488 m.519488 type:complete len:225 (-) comp57488_c0_seq64:2253-2927(-)
MGHAQALACAGFAIFVLDVGRLLYLNFSVPMASKWVGPADWFKSAAKTEDGMLSAASYYSLHQLFIAPNASRNVTGLSDEAYESAITGCLQIINNFTTSLDAEALVTALQLDTDYSERPFDDPALIGQGVPIQTGWSTLKNNYKLFDPQLGSGAHAGSALFHRPQHAVRKLQVSYQFNKSWFQPQTKLSEALDILQGQVQEACLCTIRYDMRDPVFVLVSVSAE